MTVRVVVGHDLLLAAVTGMPTGDAVAARRALRDLVGRGAELHVPAAAWPALLDALRAPGWPAALVAEALHALDGLDLVTSPPDQSTNLLVAEVMERHGLAAVDAATVVLGDVMDAPVASLRASVRSAASVLHDVRPDERTMDRNAAQGPSTLVVYRSLGAFVAELRRRESPG